MCLVALCWCSCESPALAIALVCLENALGAGYTMGYFVWRLWREVPMRMGM